MTTQIWVNTVLGNAWRHQVITWPNADFSLVGWNSPERNPTSTAKLPSRRMSLKSILLRLSPHLSGTDKLRLAYLSRNILDSFTVPLYSPNDLPAVRAVQRECHWDLKNGGNSHWSRESIMQWGTRLSHFISRPTNHKRVTPANWRPCPGGHAS